MKVPKGTLILIGGAEDKGDENSFTRNREYEEFEILQDLLPTNKSRSKKKIEIITTASSVPAEVADMYVEAFKKIGFKQIGFMNMINNDDVNNSKYVHRVKKAHSILFSGGDQFRLATILGGSAVIDAVRHKFVHDPDFVVAGTSAGAMAMSALMLYEGENNEAMLSQTVKFSSGLGFIEGCIIDTHFIKRGRFGRLAQSIIMNPSCIGIGLGEDTALVFKKGNIGTCKGSGMVMIIDGKDVGHTNIAYAEPDVPLCIENLRVHILSKRNGFALKERKFIPSKLDIKAERNSSEALKKHKKKKSKAKKKTTAKKKSTGKTKK